MREPTRPEGAELSHAQRGTGRWEPAASSGTALARNWALNLVGQGAPLVVAVVAIPLLVRGLGDARFGVLTIAWVFLGYFSLFDLGMSRALTQLLSERFGRGEVDEVPSLVRTALLVLLGLGLVGAAAAALLAPWIAAAVLDMPEALVADTTGAFYVLAASVPVVLGTAGLRGILEAGQRFDLVNAVRVPMGVFTFAGPLLVLPFSQSLTAMMLVLVAGRMVAWGAFYLLARRVLPRPEAAVRARFEQAHARHLFRFGGWMTVSHAVSPLMVYADRLVIGAYLSVSAVAYYATPWEIVTKLGVVPVSLAAVLFPTFSATYQHDAPRVARLYWTAVKSLTILLFPAVLALVLLARPGLDLWVGPEYAAQGFRVMQLLAVGTLLNAVAAVPFALVQGARRPDLTAAFHLVELPAYALVLWLVLEPFGIAGVAFAWLFRVGLDLLLLLWAASRFLPAGTGAPPRALLGLVVAVCLSSGAMLLEEPAVQVTFGVAAVGLGLPLAWRFMLQADERRFLRARLGERTLHLWRRGRREKVRR